MSAKESVPVSNEKEDKDDEYENDEEENKAAQDYLVPSSSYYLCLLLCTQQSCDWSATPNTFSIHISVSNIISLI